MKRKEQLEKLHLINLCVANLTVTCDMGLEFTTMTSQGVSTQMGNIGQWPCFKVHIDDGVSDIIKRLGNGDNVGNEEILSTSFGKAMTTYSNYIENEYSFDESKANEIVDILKEKLSRLKCSGRDFYVYASTEDWNMILEVFATESELESYFVSIWGTIDEAYDTMDDDEISEWYDIAEENGWNNLPFHTIGDIE